MPENSSVETTPGQPSQPVASSPALPENQPSEPEFPGLEHDEPDSESTAGGAGNSLVEKILGRAEQVGAQFGKILKVGRGRPKKDGSPKISDVVVPAAAPAVAAPAASSVVEPPASAGGAVPFVPAGVVNSEGASLFRESLAEGTAKIAAGLADIQKYFAVECGVSKEFADAASAAARPEAKALDRWSRLLKMVSDKHGWATKNPDEWALAITGAEIFGPQLVCAFKLWREAEKVRAEKSGAAK